MSPDYSLLGVALVLAVAGVAETRAHRRRQRADMQWLAKAVTTEGVVRRIDERETYSQLSEEGLQHSTSRVAVVSYQTASGRGYQIEASGEGRKVGSRVQVTYNPELPSDARAYEPNAYRGGCGLILICIALALAAKALWW